MGAQNRQPAQFSPQFVSPRLARRCGIKLTSERQPMRSRHSGGGAASRRRATGGKQHNQSMDLLTAIGKGRQSDLCVANPAQVQERLCTCQPAPSVFVPPPSRSPLASSRSRGPASAECSPETPEKPPDQERLHQPMVQVQPSHRLYVVWTFSYAGGICSTGHIVTSCCRVART